MIMQQGLLLVPALQRAAALAHLPGAAAISPNEDDGERRRLLRGVYPFVADDAFASHFEERHRKLQGDLCYLDSNGAVIQPGDTGYNCPDCFPNCCLQANFGIWRGKSTALSCGAQALEFQGLSGLDVQDSGAYKCNCGGLSELDCSTLGLDAVECASDGFDLPLDTWLGACRGDDDYVTVSFLLNLNVKNAQNDAALYIATDGGDDIINGPECAIAGLMQRGDLGDGGNLILRTGDPSTELANGTALCDCNCGSDSYSSCNKYGGPGEPVDCATTICDNGEGDGDECLDFRDVGLLVDYPFNSLVLKCTDSCSDGAGTCSGSKDGLIDFRVGASFTNGVENDCTYDPSSVSATLGLPTPDQTSKCWMGERLTLNIFVPPCE